MRLYFDRALRKLVVRPGFGSPLMAMEGKRGDQQMLELRIYDDGVPGELAADPEIRFGLKETLSGDLLALADAWTEASAGVYTAPFNTNTAELVAALGAADSKVFLAELTYTDADGGPTSSQTVPFTLYNDVLKEEDNTPLGLPGPDDYVAARAVLHDRVQELTSGQKLQARGNIGAVAGDGTGVSDPVAFLKRLRHSAPVLSNETALLPFWKQVLAFQETSDPAGKYIVAAGMLDSMGTTNGPVPSVFDQLYATYGVGALMSITFGALADLPWTGFTTGSGANQPLYSGGAALTPTTATGSGDAVFTYLPNGRIFTIPAGGTVTESPTTPTRNRGGYRKIRCFYGIRAGGGTATFTVSQNGVGLTPKAVNTATGTAGRIGYVDFEAADGLAGWYPPTLVTSASGGTVHYLGSLVYLNSGFIGLNMGRGSTTSTDMAIAAGENLTALQNDFGIGLCFHAAKGETDPEIAAYFARINTYMPLAAHVVVGNTPSDNASADLQSRESMRAECLNRGYLFIDGAALLGSYSKLADLGWTGDTTHLDPEAWRLTAGWIFDRLICPVMPALAGGTRLRSPLTPVTHADLAMTDFLRDTTRRASFDSLFGSSTGSGWTQTLTRGRNQIAFTTAASNAGVDFSAADVMLDYGIDGQTDASYRWQLIESFSGAGAAVTAKIGFGLNGFPTHVLAGRGYTWELGFDAGPLPWVRFELHDGVTLYTSPKFYIPIASGGEGYILGGSHWHNWAMKIDGRGNTKRLRCWVACSKTANAVQATVKPQLVADWSVTPGVPNWSIPVSYPNLAWGLFVKSAPAAGGNARLLGMEVDHNFHDPSRLAYL